MGDSSHGGPPSIFLLEGGAAFAYLRITYLLPFLLSLPPSLLPEHSSLLLMGSLS